MYKILKNIIEMDDYSVQKLSKSQPPVPFEWNTVEGTELNVSDCIGGKGKIAVKGNTYQATSILPEGYTQVDYIENTEYSYIDTGRIPADTEDIEALIQINEAGNAIYGAWTNAGDSRRHLYSTSNGINIGYGTTGNALVGVNYDEKLNINAHFESGNQILTVNNQTNTGTSTKKTNPNLNAYLFARNISGTPNAIIKMKLYKFKIYENNIPVRDFIPCYRNSDNEVGLYDLVNNVFYTNQGTGAFTYGATVTVPNPDFEIPIEVVTGNNTIKHYGKNILNCLLFENNDYVNIVEKSIGKLKLSGHNSFYVGITLRLNLKPNTNYSFRAKVTELGTNAQGKLFIVNQNYNLNGLIYIENRIATSSAITQPGELTASFTTDSTGIIGLLLQVNNATNSSTITYDNIQLEEGPATESEPHKENAYQLNLGNIELCKIGDYEDVLFKNVVGDENYNADLEVGAWYKKKLINKIVLEGNEEWYVATTNDADRFATQRITNGTDGLPILSTHLRYNQNGLTDIGTLWFSTTNGRLYINFAEKNTYSLSDFIEFLNKNNPVLYYALKQPTYEKITDPTLISQLEALNKFKWFKGVNHIWTETENLEPVLEGKYKAVVESEVP